MQTEKQRERLIELIKKSRREWLSKDYDNETEKSVDEYVADYLMSNNVVVLPENALPEISAKIVSEDKEKLVVEQEFNFHWKNKRTILKEKENGK